MKGFEDIERRMNITNSQDHPTNDMYKVFNFTIKDQAEYFSELLKENNIDFESDEEFAKGKMQYLFGVRKTDIDRVTKLNYLALGKYRKPFIADKGFKWFVILLGMGALAFAIVSFFMKK